MAVRRDRDRAELSAFAEELKAARQQAGWSSDDLAAKIGFSPSLVRMVESGNRSAQADFARQCDKVFMTAGYREDSDGSVTPGTFMRLEARLRDLPFPSSYRPFVPYEKGARVLRIFEHSLVTGLFQTEAYARAVLSKRPNTSDDAIENLVTLRLARQEILSREDPPLVYLLMDESVLHRPVGSADVMYAQLRHLADVAARPNVSIQVLPYSAGAHIGLLGAFTIAEAPDMSATVYLEHSADGHTLENKADRMAQVIANFDSLRGDALTVGASREQIAEAAERWKTETD
ncbi:MAG TPA: Scr1 family TA system antitoxin-like transcriptional regulator [Streptosporangiaceae bacterium]|jgi:transcriptional regulator with XRE-family HTH domain